MNQIGPMHYYRQHCDKLLSVLPVVIVAAGLLISSCATHQYGGRDDLKGIFETEDFRVIYRVNQLSLSDWAAEGVIGRSKKIVDPGEPYDSGDMYAGGPLIHQLLVGAKSRRHEVVCFWVGTHGGPTLCVRMLRRGSGRPTLIFSAIMKNDIRAEDWNWEQIKQHIRDNRMDVLSDHSARQPNG